MSLHFTAIAMHLEIKVPYASLQRHLPASPERVGDELAVQVHDYVKQHGLGYYPALNFFERQGGVDADLLQAVESISWLASEMVCNEVRLRLRPVFSSVRFESVQTAAYTLPHVRVGQTRALAQLAHHYTPDVIKLNIVATLVQKLPDTAAAERLARGLLARWLENRFEKLNICSVKAI